MSKDEKTPRILKVHWNCYGKCNLGCGFCYGLFEGYPALGTSEGIEILSKVSKEGVKTFVFAGGDPLLRSDLTDLICFAKDLGLRIELQTNAHILTEKRIEELFPIVDCWGLSLDSSVEEIHDLERKGLGNYRRVISSIENLIIRKANLNIRTVVSKRTSASVYGISKILRDFDFSGKWYLLQYDPLGDEKHNREHFEIPRTLFDEVVAQITNDSSFCENNFKTISVPYTIREGIYFLIAPDGSVYRTHLVSLRTKYIAFRQPLIRQFNDLIGSWGFAYQNE
jgi:MoaA/NifB/PqqE/SkfB family radical SAM enzyme